MTGKAIGVQKGGQEGGRRWLATSHPHLASPLKGGRDELGKGVGGGVGRD